MGQSSLAHFYSEYFHFYFEFRKSKILMHLAFLNYNFNRVEKFGLQPIFFSTRLRFLEVNPKGCNWFYSTRNNPNPVKVHNTNQFPFPKKGFSKD
jgi:hypothetical protein